MTNFKSFGLEASKSVECFKVSLDGKSVENITATLAKDYKEWNSKGDFTVTIIPREQKSNNNFSKWLYTCFGLNAKRSYKKLKYYIKDKKKHDRNFRNLLQI